MKKILALILVALMVVPFGVLASVGVSAAEEVIYVKDGGTGDGSAPDNALGSIVAANALAATKTTDVTIKFVGTVTIDTDIYPTETKADEGIVKDYYMAPSHKTTKITWAGHDNTSKLVVNTGTAARMYVIGGDMCVENLEIETVGSKSFIFVTGLYDFTMGEGINNYNNNTAAETIKIYGATSSYYKNDFYNETTLKHTANSTITVKSGKYGQVVGYMGNASNNLCPYKLGEGKQVVLDGTITINVSGTATIGNLYPVANSYNTVKNCNITLDGGIIEKFVGATDRKYVKGIKTYAPSGVSGEYTLYLTKNFDLAAQTALTGPEFAGEFYGGLCGATANDDYTGALDDAGLGTYVLKADAEIFDAVNAETVKINKATFDSVVKVTAPETNAGGATTTAPGTTTPPANNPNTGDSFVIIAVVATIAAAAIIVTSKKKITR